ncbi:MAG: TIGR04282 family arsenosugar biosynthesis glycosyltransferase [Pseudomonadota bacterium]
MRGTLVIFLKEPQPGRVKTRLGAEIGMTRAAWWFRHQAHSLIRQVGRDPRWRTVLAVSPDAQGLSSRVWPPDLPRWPQGNGELGDRMARALKAMAPGPAMVIGADIPEIDRHHIAVAFATLRRNDAVLGPARDGGYWLIGLKHPRAAPANMFEGVRWSTEHAMTDTVQSLDGLKIGHAATLSDVDTAADL